MSNVVNGCIETFSKKVEIVSSKESFVSKTTICQEFSPPQRIMIILFERGHHGGVVERTASQRSGRLNERMKHPFLDKKRIIIFFQLAVLREGLKF